MIKTLLKQLLDMFVCVCAPACWCALSSLRRTLIHGRGSSLEGGCTAEVENLNASYLEHFARVHSQPLLQNYSWTLKDQLDGIGMPIGVLWANYCFA